MFLNVFSFRFQTWRQPTSKGKQNEEKNLKRRKSLQRILVKRLNEKEIKTNGRQKEAKPELDAFKAAERIKAKK